jgi:T5SS/PEP-CTERM-associated repeat protein/autotransporter-associated beta strand protein
MVVSGGAFVVNGMTDIQGVLLTNGGTGVIGLKSASSNNSVLITGTGSTWIDGGDLFVGSSASGNSLEISNGGTVINWSVAYGGVIGLNVGSSNNRVLVTGAGSTWNVHGNLTIGDAGSGTLTVANGGSAVAGAIVVASSGGSSGTLNIGSLGGGDKAGTIDSPTIAFGAGSGTINFNQFDTSTMTSAISGNGFINQLGSGTTILSGSNNYSGTTTVKSGLLLANSSSALGTSTVIVTNTGTLGGIGAIQGATTIANGGTLAAGSGGVGSLSFNGGLTLEAGSTTLFQIHSTSDFTSINLIGSSVTYGGTLVFNLINYVPVAGNEFTFFNMTGATESGNFSSVQVGSSYLNYAAGVWSGLNNGVTYQFNDVTGKLTVQAVPEPSTWALLGLGALGMLIALRRRGLA